MLAESLDAQLKRMGQDLKEIIERLNATNSKPDNNDPVSLLSTMLFIISAMLLTVSTILLTISNMLLTVSDILSFLITLHVRKLIKLGLI